MHSILLVNRKELQLQLPFDFKVPRVEVIYLEVPKNISWVGQAPNGVEVVIVIVTEELWIWRL